MLKILKSIRNVNKFRLRSNKSLKKEIKRKMIHLSSLWIPLVVYILPSSLSVLFFSFLFLINTLLEYGNYKKWAWARLVFGKLFTQTLRSKEINKQYFQFSGSLYILLAAVSCSMLFSKQIAVIALTIMLISDTSAAIFGKLYGSRKIHGQKSLEGTTAFFISSLIIMILFNHIFPVTYASIIACMLATLAELYEDRIDIDDNLAISFSTGIVLTFLG